MRVVFVLLVGALFLGCGSPEAGGFGVDEREERGGARPRNPVDTGQPLDTETPDTREAQDTLPTTDTPDTTDTTDTTEADVPDTHERDIRDFVDRECASVDAAAAPVFAPVDIIWAIDTSGSMNQEKALVESKLNEFVDFVESSGLDIRVVMIGDNTVCVPEPLSGGGCPDVDSERYLHVRQGVSSHDAYERIIGTHSQYAHFLRPDASLHIVVVSDDESYESAGWFRDRLAEKGITRWVFHAIVSLVESCFLFACEGCSGPYGDAEAKGDMYMVAAEMTGGTSNSICNPDWSAVFRAIGDNVVLNATLPCNYAIPDVGVGREVVYSAVDVEINGALVPRLSSESECAGSAGWYYDDPAAPTQIIICPSACGDGFEGDELEIQFGCVKG